MTAATSPVPPGEGATLATVAVSYGDMLAELAAQAERFEIWRDGFQRDAAAAAKDGATRARLLDMAAERNRLAVIYRKLEITIMRVRGDAVLKARLREIHASEVEAAAAFDEASHPDAEENAS